MNNSASQLQLFVELRQKLSSGLIIIRSDLAKGKDDVTISGGDSTLNIHVPDGIIKVKLPTNVRLLDGSGQSPDLKDDGLHIRLRLKVGPCSDIADDVMQNLKAQKKCCVLCQSCGSPLTNERVFRRVLPLPNGNWNALVDDWCCHPDPFANKKLLPKEDDCLVGDTFYLLTRDLSSERNITQTADSSGFNSTSTQHSDKVPSHRNAVLMCRKCSVVLGEAVTTETLKLYISDVVVKQLEDETFTFIQDRQKFLERMLASKLVELSSAQSTFRFSIQTPGSKAVIMLWLLNTDTLLAFSERVMSSDDLISSSNADSIQHPSHQAVSVIKVLYLPCAGCQHTEAVDAWEKDISVHPLILPQSTCEEVLDLLKSSTSTLPSSLRCMNCYQVAYLKR